MVSAQCLSSGFFCTCRQAVQAGMESFKPLSVPFTRVQATAPGHQHAGHLAMPLLSAVPPPASLRQGGAVIIVYSEILSQSSEGSRAAGSCQLLECRSELVDERKVTYQ